MTGLIYVVIIALWAAVLIPIWLRRHDHISEVRSTARFSSAMKSLGNPGQVRYASGDPDFDASLMETQRLERPSVPRRAPDREDRMPRPAPAPARNARPAEGLDPSYERELVRQAAATRRAIVLGVLTVLLVAALLLAVLGVLPRWAPIAAAIPVVAFVIATAMTAAHRTSARPSRREEAPRRSERFEPAEPAAAVADDDWENWNAWDDEDSWEAVPATLPTYVSAPRASAVPRPIDKAHPREWDGAAMVETAQAMRTRPRSESLASAADIDYGAATAEIPVVRDEYDGRRVVNE